MALTILKLVKEKFRTELAVDLMVDIVNASANAIANPNTYFIFAGRNQPWPNNDTSIISPSDADNVTTDTWQNMIFGKAVSANDVVITVPRNDWVANTVFAMYSDADANLYTKNFFAVVNVTSTYFVFKCLFNANGGPSTIQPSISVTGCNQPSFTTSDGYIWKYMYQVNQANWNLFATTSFMPVIPDANVTGNAVPGAIDVILVNNPGFGYGNFLQGQFNSSDIQVGGNSLIYGISNTAIAVNNFYNQCLLFITSGTGAGQFKNVVTYRTVGLVKEVIVDSAFTVVPDATSQYQVNPAVSIVGDGTQTINCIARALINAFSANSVYAVDVVQRGQNYRLATASVLVDPSVGITNAATLQVILPPAGGHGANVFEELGGTATAIAVQFANTEGNTISTANEYRQAGLLRNPLWANVTLNLNNSSNTSGTNGRFINGEFVFQFQSVLLAGTVNVVAGNSQVIGTGTDFTNQFVVNDYIFINGANNVYIGQVNSIVNSSFLTLTSNISFNNTAAIPAQALIISKGLVTSVTPSSVTLTKVSNPFIANTGTLVGNGSFAFATITSSIINGVTKPYTTFQQLITLNGTLQSGAFIPNETIFQSNLTTTNAVFFSGNSTVLSVTDEVGVFTTGNVVGSNSGAIFTVTSTVAGDLVLNSGEIFFLENFNAIPRSNVETERVVLIIQF